MSHNDCPPIESINPPHEHPDNRESLLQMLRNSGWNQSEAARKLGVSRVTVWKRMKKYGLKRPE
jgi:transcriptional regulator of acetoin/glycerol metabolism